MDVARAHLDGVAALLEAADGISVLDEDDAFPETGLPVFVGTAPTSSPPIYAVLTVSTPEGVNERLSGHRSARTCRVALMHVAKTQREVLWAVGLTQAAVERKRPVSPGRSCTPMQGGGGPVRPDTSVTPADWIATDSWRFASTPNQEEL